MLMPMLAAARGIERRRFAGGAWMSDAGGAPMRSSVPAPIAVIVEAVDASWQTGVLNDLSACRGVSMINVATNGRTNAVMTGAAIAAAIIAIISRATGADRTVRWDGFTWIDARGLSVAHVTRRESTL